MGEFMYKKLSILLAMLFAVPAMAGEFSNVQDASESGTFELEHEVTRESYFKTIVATSLIVDEGRTKLGRIIVRNNTRDGYKVSISSAEGGALVPASTDDGEENILYDLSLSKSGDVGEGMNLITSITTTALNLGPVDFLYTAFDAGSGEAVSSPTDVSFDLNVVITDDSNVMEMAGSYSDTLTVTYTDL
jgi:hypothetical protein